VIHVYLGNPAPVEGVVDPSADELTLVALDVPGGAVTTVDIAHDDLFAAVAEVRDLWRYHSSGPPTWVASDHDGLAAVLASGFGCPAIDIDAGVAEVVAANDRASTAAGDAMEGTPGDVRDLGDLR
jgi:hypothetical protein